MGIEATAADEKLLEAARVQREYNVCNVMEYNVTSRRLFSESRRPNLLEFLGSPSFEAFSTEPRNLATSILTGTQIIRNRIHKRSKQINTMASGYSDTRASDTWATVTNVPGLYVIHCSELGIQWRRIKCRTCTNSLTEKESLWVWL